MVSLKSDAIFLWLGLMGNHQPMLIEQINKAISGAHLLFQVQKPQIEKSTDWITLRIVIKNGSTFGVETCFSAQAPSSFGADGEKCAVKSFKKHGLSEKRRNDLKNEARQLRQLLGCLEDFGGLRGSGFVGFFLFKRNWN